MNRFMLFILCLVLGVVAQAQPKIGLTFSPSVSSNRVNFKSDLGEITNDGAGIRLKLGMVAEFDMTDTYAFSTGLIYAPKRVGFTIVPDGGSARTEGYKSQYLQIPLTMKLYTSEVVPDVKGFFQLGFLAEVKIFSEAQDDTFMLVEKFKPYDATFVFGVGAQYDAGASSVINIAIVYNRGLINVISETETGITDLVTKLDMISLEMGITF